MWGSNAVNGIINIISKNSKDTQGLMISVGGGSEDKGITSVRYGGSSEDNSLHYRVYGKWFERDRSFLPSGGAQLPAPTFPAPGAPAYSQAQDDWRKGQSGFRVDWNATECDTFQLQGDFFEVSSSRGDFRPITTPPFVVQNGEDEVTTGGNLLARWQHETGKDSNWGLQFYWDHFGRVSTNDFFKIRADTFDLDFQQQFPLGDDQKFIYGMGYRAVESFFGGDGFALSATPNPIDRTLSRYAAFLQDEFTLIEDKIYFTAGSKFEHNTLAGFQYQPTGRLLWTPSERQSAWGAVSRAVRTPSIRDDGIVVTGIPNPVLPVPPGTVGFAQTRGSSNLNAEDLMAYELGYRAQPNDEFSFDTALFYNVYDNLIAFKSGTPVPGPAPGTLVFPANAVNGMSAETYGIELSATLKLTETWRLQGNYTFLQMLLHRDVSGISVGQERGPEGQSPQNQVYLQSSWDLTKTVEFDLIGRYVDHLSNFPSASPNSVPSYIAMDARLGWRPNKSWELSVVGQNLLDSHHLEFGGNTFLTAPLIEMQRGVYGMVTWRH